MGDFLIKNFETEFKQIDKQHELFFKICYLIEEGMKFKTITGENLINVYNLLAGYINFHLKSEEEYLETIKDAPKEFQEKIKRNEIEHQFFRTKILEFKKIKKEDERLKSLRNFSFNWFTHHIIKTDKDFCSYLKNSDLEYNKKGIESSLQKEYERRVESLEKELLIRKI